MLDAAAYALGLPAVACLRLNARAAADAGGASGVSGAMALGLSALAAPQAALALCAALRAGWHAPRREALLAAARAAQLAGGLALAAARRWRPAPAPAPPRSAGADADTCLLLLVFAAAALAPPLLARVRFRALGPAQLLHLAALSAAVPPAVLRALAAPAHSRAHAPLLCAARLVAGGWAAPAAAALALELRARRAFVAGGGVLGGGSSRSGSGSGGSPSPRSL